LPRVYSDFHPLRFSPAPTEEMHLQSSTVVALAPTGACASPPSEEREAMAVAGDSAKQPLLSRAYPPHVASACRHRPSRPRRGRRGPPWSAASRGCSTSPTVLDRERAIVVNHEQIRCVITVGAMEERAWPDLASDLLMAGEGKKGGGAESRGGTTPRRRATAAGR
jgi:hypothetical protein